MLGELQKTIETKDITVSVQEDTLAKLEKRVVDLKKERDQWKALTIRTEKRLRDIVSARQKSGWTEILGVPVLRVKDEYWVDLAGWCELLDLAWTGNDGLLDPAIWYRKPGTSTPLRVVYKEVLD